jgi:16S rRNA (cytosine967-C5)-methyltransferase
LSRSATARLPWQHSYNWPVRRELLDLAALVLSQADRNRPADAVLRHELGRRRNLTALEARFVAEAVFSFYRWFGWVNPISELADQVAEALEHQERFSCNPASFPIEELAHRAIPDWTASQLDVTDAWLRSLQTVPSVWLRLRSDHAAQTAAQLGNCVPVAGIPNAHRYVGGEDLFRRPEFHRGEFEIQDLSSQIVGHLCAPQPGETWWDACAGEGGKALHLSDLMQNKGLIWASDRALWRLEKLKRRAARARMFNYRLTQWDGARKLRTKFDGVLVDAPCSGVGTWQRNPHARWTTTLEDVLQLKDVQLRLLNNAAASVKPGGKLIYAVCTLTRAETIEVTTEFQRTRPHFAPLAMRHPVTGLEASQLWLWPQEFGGNGMFIAAWRFEP